MSLFFRSFITFIFIIAFLIGELYAQKKPIRLAIFPYLSMSKIIQHNKKLKEYLEKELQRPITIITSEDFRSYVDGVKKGSFDLLFTAPHIGRYGELKANYQAIAATRQFIQGYFIVKKDSPIKSLEDLKGKTISMAPSIALVHQTALIDLKEAGITIGRNIFYKPAKSHTQALINLLQGHSDIALSGVNIWKKLPKKHKSQLRILKKSRKAPGFLLMGHEKISPALIEQIKQSVLKFHRSKEGMNYLFKGYQPIDKSSMQDLDIYIKDLY